ncbi:AAA family ATPase [Streptomyces sp. DSM 44915]|uniref:AAA family ATPase n=1 Tax=Streptomyces chisholmiae TaxID=3075540 RepID=A0ABU2K0R7_9ACTN|nr:AAA family ATPase [Streptomyces sp. DSM 44915]MDT0270851.1 AAA family ATPase [Streptomyces sp. DSM 44915]
MSLDPAVRRLTAVETVPGDLGAIPWPEEDTQAEPAPRRVLRITRASEIEAEPVVWAWEDEGEGRVPAGALTVAAGREGTGKSSFGMWMAAHVTRGTLPGSFQGRPRGVFYVAVEDSWKQTIVPRLIAAGADLDRVYRVDAIEAEYGETTLSLPQDNSLVEKAIEEYDIALVVLDPLMSCIGKGIDTHRERDVRTALDPLARMADRTGAVLLGIAHFSKGAGTDPAALITGSGAFKNVPRAVFGFARDDDNECRVMTQAKNSLGRADLPSLSYNVESAEVPTRLGPANVGKFVFTGQSTRTVDEILAAGAETDKTERDEAAEWLRGYLMDHGGEASSKDVKAAAQADDISVRTVQRAMSKAGVTAERAGFGKGSVWRLNPPKPTTDSEGESPVAPQSRQSRQGSNPGANGATGGATGADAQPESQNVTAGPGVCAGCGEAMALIEPGQTAHPGCDAPPDR